MMMAKSCKAIAKRIQIAASFSSGRSIYIFSVPKSGSSWVEQLLSTVIRYPIYTPYQDILKEVKCSGALDFPFQKDLIKLQHSRLIIKTHTTGFNNGQSLEVVDSLNCFGLVRDPTHVIRSYIHHVLSDYYHPRNRFYRSLNCMEGQLDRFMEIDYERFLSAYYFYRFLSSKIPVFDYNHLLGSEGKFLESLVKLGVLQPTVNTHSFIKSPPKVKFDNKIFGLRNTICPESFQAILCLKYGSNHKKLRDAYENISFVQF